MTPKDAAQVIDAVEPLQHRFQQQLGSRFAWLSDEWYRLQVGLCLPRQL